MHLFIFFVSNKSVTEKQYYFSIIYTIIVFILN